MLEIEREEAYLMVKVSANRYARKRIEKAERETEIHMEALRRSLTKSMEELFQLAGKIVRGKMRRQRVEGRLKRITREQRERWLKIAEKAAETIAQISENIDERQIKTQLKTLHELISQIEQP